ncbi:MAG: glycosyltransferase family 10 domain-containing protein [Campylobacterales bacterium]
MKKIKIKISTNFPNFPIERQLPNCNHVFGNFEFFINRHVDNPDYWIVYHDLSNAEECNAFKGTLILFTSEPGSVHLYNQKFLNQFDVVVTSQTNLKHKNKILSHTSLHWHIGRVLENGQPDKFTRNYDELANEKIYKSKLLSVISSNKTISKGHKERLEFVQKLKNYFGEQIDLFGHGLNDFSDKWDVIAPYKYHIVLENTSQKYYWTEKLSDCYLGEAYPIYYGCTNLNEYFNDKAFSYIDIKKFRKSVEIIEKVISNNFYENFYNEIIESKKLVLNDYNFFNFAIKLCASINKSNQSERVSLKPQRYFKSTTKKLRIFLKSILSD